MMFSFDFNWLDTIIIPAGSILIIAIYNFLAHKHNKATEATDTESVAYQRVDFLTKELETLRQDLNEANSKIAALEMRTRQRDLDLLEQERLKNLALSEVTRLKIENQELQIKLERQTLAKQINET